MPRRTNPVQRARTVVRDARAEAHTPLTRDDLAMAGRRAAYVVTGNESYRRPLATKSVVAGVPHYDRKPLN